MIKSTLRLLLILLGLIGLVDCLFIAGTIHLSEGQCSGLGTCGKVLNSTYANLFGVSLWKFGAAFYIFYTAILIVAVLRNRRFLLLACLILLFSGVCFSAYLIFLQAFKIRSWCPLCLLSASIQLVSFAGCLYLWFRRDHDSSDSEQSNDPQSQSSLLGELFASLAVAGFVFASTLTLSSKLWGRVATFRDSKSFESQLVTQLGENEVTLSDFPEYLTMKHEFDQFVWTKSRQWYRAELLTYVAKERGFSDSTAFINHEFVEAGETISIDAAEANRRFEKLKEEYRRENKPLPSDEKLFQELQDRYQRVYDDFVVNLTDRIEKEEQAEFLLRPPSISLSIAEDLVPTLGPKDAPVQIVEISDFHCAHCRKMHALLKEIRDEIGSENLRVTYVNHYWTELPGEMTTEQATLTMRAAYAAWKQDQFWEFADEVFENQDRVNIDSLPALKKIAAGLKLDLVQFEGDLTSQEAHDFIQAQRPLQEQSYAERPPTLLLNGFFVKPKKETILSKIEELKLL